MFTSGRFAAASVLCVVLAGFLGLQAAIAEDSHSAATSSQSGGASTPTQTTNAPESNSTNGATAGIAGLLSEPLTPEAVDKILAGLSDKEIRQILLERLAAESQPKEQAAATPLDGRSIVDQIIDAVIDTAARIADNVIHTPETVSSVSALVAGYVASMGWDGALTFAAAFAVAIGLGASAEFLFDRRVAQWRKKVTDAADTAEHSTLLEALGTLSKRFVSDMAGVILFFFVVTVTLILLMPDAQVAVARMFAIWLILFPRIGITLLRFLFAPKRHSLRLVYTDDWTANFLYRNYVGIIVTLGIALAMVQFTLLVGTADSQQRVGFWLNLLIFVWLGIVTVRAQSGLRMMMRGRSENLTKVEAWVANVYPWFAFTAIVATYLISIVLSTLGLEAKLQGGRHLETLALLLLAPLLDTIVRALVRHLAPPMLGNGPLAEQASQSVRRSYTRMGRVIVFGAVILYIAKIWDVSLGNVASAGMGAQFATNIVEVLLVLAIGYFVSELFRLLINQKLANEHSIVGLVPSMDEHSGVQPIEPSSRLATVLPLLGWALQIFIIAMTVLVALDNIGVNVTAILAGAGIFGIAIGFGSQKLVADVVSGFFFLLEDAFRVGEWVEVGGEMAGTVEKFNIRSLQLRHPRGPMHCVPYGSISRVTNGGREYSIMKLRFTVPFDTDIEKVRKIFKQIGQQLLEHPELGSGIIQTFKSQGVYTVNEQGIVVRGKYMAKPGKQFGIRKEVYRLVMQEFEKNGIQFARKEVRVDTSNGHSATESATLAAAAAASES